MEEFTATVDWLKPDIVGVTESWGNDDISDSEFNLPGFSVFRADRGNGHRGGGVLLLVNNIKKYNECCRSNT